MTPRLLVIVVAALAACAGTRERGSLPATGGVTLAHDVAGAGEPVVLLQGGQLGRDLWDEVARDLARDHFVVCPDLRGYGESPASAAPYAHHEDVLALLDALGLRSAHVVGLSLGGRVAIDTALVAPERVRSLVLSGPGLSGWAFESASFASIAEAVEAGDSHLAAERWLEHPYITPSMEDPSLAHRVRALALANHQVWGRPDGERALAPPATERLGDLRAPVLILVGTRDVADIQRIAGRIAAEARTAERRDIQGGGHLLPLEQPAAFANSVREWVAAHR